MVDIINNDTFKNNISIIIRVTESCNLNCRYCYVTHSPRKIILPLSKFHKIIQEVGELGFHNIDLYWHGGEPLLAGIDYYEEALEIENALADKYKLSIKNRLQTNGTLLNKEWITILQKNKISIGLSLDGDKIINDRNRVFADGKSSFEQAVASIKLMKSAGLNIGILTVLTMEHIPRIEEYYKFIKELGIDNFKINPCFINKPEIADLQVDGVAWGKAMISLFDLWFSDNNPPVNRDFQSIIKSFFFGKSFQCIFNRDCFNCFISITPSGDIYPCTRLIDSKYTFRLGNIDYGIMEALLKLSSITRNYDDIGCGECKWQDICHGGCSAYAFWAYGEVNAIDYLCEGYKLIFQHIYDNVKHNKINAKLTGEFL